jgi:O-antigen ligase
MTAPHAVVAPPVPDWGAGISLAAFAAGFFFSFRAALVMISARWLHLETEDGVIAGLAIQSALLVAITFQAVGPAARTIVAMTRQSTVRWALCFLAFSCSSLMWSATISRAASFLYWSAMASDVAIVVLLLRGRPAGEIARSLMRGFIAATCVLACIAWIMPASDDLRLGDPDYFNTNQIGNLCAMAVFMAQFLTARKDGRWRLEIFFLTVTLLRSLSKATIVAFIVAEGLLMIRDRTMRRKTKTFIALAAVLLVAAYWGLIGSYLDAYTSAGNQAQTLTGRTAIWAYTLDVSLDRPWFGNGIDAMWKVFPPFGREMFEARHAENELLQQFYAYGLAGIVMLVGLYASLFRAILRGRDGISKSILAAVMLFIFVRGFAEAEPFDLLLPLWMITLFSSIVDQRGESHAELTSSQVSAPALAAGLANPRSAAI